MDVFLCCLQIFPLIMEEIIQPRDIVLYFVLSDWFYLCVNHSYTRYNVDTSSFKEEHVYKRSLVLVVF